ncbi:WG repeat-containing protein [bacterium]|nr:WG repeat-containing protein [bacterium]
MICPECSKENKNTAKFCTGCGTSLKTDPKTQPLPKGTRKKMVMWIIALGIVATIGCLLVWEIAYKKKGVRDQTIKKVDWEHFTYHGFEDERFKQYPKKICQEHYRDPNCLYSIKNEEAWSDGGTALYPPIYADFDHDGSLEAFIKLEYFGGNTCTLACQVYKMIKNKPTFIWGDILGEGYTGGNAKVNLEDPSITVSFPEHTYTDARCCPSFEKEIILAWENDKFMTKSCKVYLTDYGKEKIPEATIAKINTLNQRIQEVIDNNDLSDSQKKEQVRIIQDKFEQEILTEDVTDQKVKEEIVELFAVAIGKKWGFFKRLVGVAIGERWGYIDKNGKYVINPQFDFARSFSEGLAMVMIDGKCGYIDKSGKYVINPQFDFARSFSEGLAMVRLDEKCGYIDKNGKYVINPQFDFAGSFSEGLARVEIGEKWGYIDKSGKYVINPQFDLAWCFSEGLAGVEIGEKWGYIDRSGKYVINSQFDLAWSFSEGLAVVRIGEKCGYIDRSGKYVINPQFDNAGNFSERLAMVRIGEKWGYIDRSGKYVINPQFDDAWRFSEGLAMVTIDGKCGYIDRSGKYVINPQFDDAWRFFKGPTGEVKTSEFLNLK